MLKSFKLHFLKITFCSICVMGFNLVSSAQLTIVNDSDCRIQIKTAQSDDCSACNSSGLQLLNPNGTYTHPYDASCPDPWLGVKFRVFSSGGAISTGLYYNPFTGCGIPVQATCEGNDVNVGWLSSGAGSTVVNVNISN